MSLSSVSKSILQDKLNGIDEEIKRLQADISAIKQRRDKFVEEYASLNNRIEDLKTNKVTISNDLNTLR